MALPKEYGKNNKPLPFTRQKAILERLNNGEELSIKALAREWGVSTKTLQRDFDKLASADFGIERAPNGKSYRKARKVSSHNDSDLIIEMIEAMSKEIGGKFYTKAHHLLAQLKKSVDAPFYTRIDVEDISDKFDTVKTLENAIQTKKSLRFTYSPWWSGDGPKRYSGACPIKIVVYSGFWYLLAEHEGVYKKFYLKEIKDAAMEKNDFQVNPEILERLEDSVNIWFAPDVEPYEVTLWLEPDVVVYFERLPIAKSQKLYKQPDGSAELIVKITTPDEIFPIVKWYLPSIRIMEPEALREEFEEMLKAYCH